MFNRSILCRLALLASVVVPALATYHDTDDWDYTRRLTFPWRDGEPCPDAIEAGIGSKKTFNKNMDSIQEMLDQCPTFKALAIRGGFDDYDYYYDYGTAIFEFEEYAGQPVVKSIKVDEWNTWGDPHESKFWNRLTKYFDIFEISQVKELDFSGRVPLKAFVDGTDSLFPELDTVRLSHRPRDLDHAIGLLFSMPKAHAQWDHNPGLVNLTWEEGWHNLIIEPLLDHHGSSLEFLQLISSHDSYYSLNDLRRHTLSVDDFDLLSRRAEKLQHLEVGINRTCSLEEKCEWPLESLATIASSQSIKSIHLRLQSEDFVEDRDWDHDRSLPSKSRDDAEPYLTVDSAEEVFMYMTNLNTAGSLERVVFEVDDEDCHYDWGMWHTRPALEGSMCAVECTVPSEDGLTKYSEDAACVVTKKGPRYNKWDDDYYYDWDDDDYDDYDDYDDDDYWWDRSDVDSQASLDY